MLLTNSMPVRLLDLEGCQKPQITQQTENFSTHWVGSPRGVKLRVTDLEAYVKRRLLAVGDFKDLRKKIVSQSLVHIDRITLTLQYLKVRKLRRRAIGLVSRWSMQKAAKVSNNNNMVQCTCPCR
jgi:hypothetical protein